MDKRPIARKEIVNLMRSTIFIFFDPCTLIMPKFFMDLTISCSACQHIQSLLTSAPMEMNENLVKYNGGNEIKIPKIAMTGLGWVITTELDFPAGDVTLTWQTRELTQDRGREFSIDAMDVDESNFVATAGNVMGEFQRTKVAPEIDAYRYSTIFSYANDALKTEAYTPDDADIFEQLVGDIADVQDIVGENESMTIYMSYSAAKLLDMLTVQSSL